MVRRLLYVILGWFVIILSSHVVCFLLVCLFPSRLVVLNLSFAVIATKEIVIAMKTYVNSSAKKTLIDFVFI